MPPVSAWLAASLAGFLTGAVIAAVTDFLLSPIAVGIAAALVIVLAVVALAFGSRRGAIALLFMLTILGGILLLNALASV